MEERLRRLARKAASGGADEKRAFLRAFERSGGRLWIEVDGDEVEIDVVQELPGPVRAATVTTPGGEDYNGLLLLEDEDAAGAFKVEQIRHLVENDPEYPRRMLGPRVDLWARGEPVFTGYMPEFEPGRIPYSGGYWVNTLEDWIELHANFFHDMDATGMPGDVDDYSEALPYLLGFKPGIAFRQW
jgi:hypothetical protein